MSKMNGNDPPKNDVAGFRPLNGEHSIDKHSDPLWEW